MGLQGGGFQFARAEFYSAAGGRKRGMTDVNKMQHRDKNWSAKEVASEAMRVEGNCDHVTYPREPKILFGVSALVAADEAEAWGKTARQGNGKAYRKDAPVMAAGVLSLPRDRLDDWKEYKREAVEWLKDHYGERLRSVVEHLDEGHPHLHFYVVPLPTDKDFTACHAGYAARVQAVAEKRKSGEVCDAYKKAMKEWQDAVFDGLSCRFDLARIGPRRARKSREQYLVDAAADRIARNNRLADELADKALELEHKAMALEHRSNVVDRREAAVAGRESAVIQRESAVEAKEQACDARATALAEQDRLAGVGRVALGAGAAKQKMAEFEVRKVRGERDAAWDQSTANAAAQVDAIKRQAGAEIAKRDRTIATQAAVIANLQAQIGVR